MILINKIPVIFSQLLIFLVTCECQVIVRAPSGTDGQPTANVLAPRAIEPLLIVHGGAGDIPDSRDLGKFKGTKMAARIGYAKLLETGSALDAVEAAVRSMELDTNFNAGYGSVLTYNATVEMDASIMVGENLNAGCVTIVKDILHPITLARRVMERTPHTFLGGDGVMEFARAQGIEILSPPGQLVTQASLDALNAFKEDQRTGRDTYNAKTEVGHGYDLSNDINGPIANGHVKLNGIERDYGEVGTVGAVAIDSFGNIAAATSTGGITGKLPGRIGDTPILGSGTYADNRSGGISTTGHGETILRFNVAQKISQRIQFLSETAQQATEQVLREMTDRLTQTAGAITIDAQGNVGMFWTSMKMAWAYQRGNEVHYGIRLGEDFIEFD